MNKTELILAPGTSPKLKELVERLPPYDLLKAYREARTHFNTPDIVLVVVADVELSGFQAFPRPAYIEKAFVRWNEAQRAAHPLVRESANKKLQMPADSLGFWLVVEMHEANAVACCAVGAYLHKEEENQLS
jgi:hypothetical protein